MNGALSLGDRELNPEGARTLREQTLPEIFRRCRALVAARRQAPTGDLTSVHPLSPRGSTPSSATAPARRDGRRPGSRA
jgi:hypothetical protein